MVINSKEMPHAFQTKGRHDYIGRKSLQWIGNWPKFLFLFHKQKQSNNKKFKPENLFNIFLFGREMLITYKQFLKQKKCIMNLSIARKGFPFCLNHLINLSNPEIKLVRGNKSTSFPLLDIETLLTPHPAWSQSLGWCPWPLPQLMEVVQEMAI